MRMTDTPIDALNAKLDKLIEIMTRLAPPEIRHADMDAADCFVWSAEKGVLEPVNRVNRVGIGLIKGVDRVRDILVENTERFAAGLPANNVLGRAWYGKVVPRKGRSRQYQQFACRRQYAVEVD